MAVLVWAVLLLPCVARLALGGATCEVRSEVWTFNYGVCHAKRACCATDQVTGAISINYNPTLQAGLIGNVCPVSHPQPCCCTEEPYKPVAVSRCDTIPATIAYYYLTCPPGSYRLCCNPEEQLAAEPPPSIPICVGTWSYPCCCYAADLSSSTSVEEPTPELPHGSLQFPHAPAQGSGPALGPGPAVGPAPVAAAAPRLRGV